MGCEWKVGIKGILTDCKKQQYTYMNKFYISHKQVFHENITRSGRVILSGRCVVQYFVNNVYSEADIRQRP